MPVPTATIEHMFDIAVSAGDCDTPEATARELVNAAATRIVRCVWRRLGVPRWLSALFLP
ncbi:hypothetical protein SAMN04489714_0954 [Schaalia radingae]|uniref:Uncharacterized protein n=1 Tax=Schaalia radingae TaxID=131110 RepID=A0ABY0V718_9ACTO|nr:hypothetical protein SAMN04489714_0954 [Schaalia radingae]